MRKLGSVLVVAAVIGLLWQALYWMVGDTGLASPAHTARRLAELSASQRFQEDVWESLRAFGAAALITVVAGVIFGLLLGMHRLTGNVAEPMLVTLYSIPKVSLYPIVLLIFGLGISARIAFGVMHGVIPTLLFSMNAVRNIKPVLVRSARVMHLTRRQTLTQVVLPAALPGILTGLRIGVSVTLLGVLIGEMFAAKRGLGFRLINAISNADIPTIMAIALALSIFALALNYLLLVLTRRAA